MIIYSSGSSMMTTLVYPRSTSSQLERLQLQSLHPDWPQPSFLLDHAEIPQDSESPKSP